MRSTLCGTLILLAVAAAPASAWQALLADTPPDARPFALAVDAAGNVYTGGRAPGDDGASVAIAARLDAPDGALAWQRTFPGTGFGDHVVRALLATATGDQIVVGQVINDATKADALIARVAAASGEDVWRRDIDGGTNGSDDARAVALLPGGDVVVVGTSPKPGVIGSVAVWRLAAATGAHVWTTRLPSPGGAGQRVAAAGDAVFVGAHVPEGQGTRFTVTRLARADGTTAWSVPIVGSGYVGDEMTALVASDETRVVLAGRLADPAGGSAFAVVALDGATGAETWRVVLDGTATGASDLDVAYALAADGPDAVVAVGNLSNVGSQDDIVVAKLAAADGQELWRASASGTAADSEEARDVAVDPDGDVVVAARLRNDGTNRDLEAIKLDGGTGALLWSRSVDGTASGNDTAFNVAVDAGGHVAVAGRVRNGELGDGYVVVRFAGATGGDFPCGDGLPDAGEACDDGNTVAGDGCRTDCTAEVCGDGRRDPQEACDDGEPDGDDCCSPACTVIADEEPCSDGDACTSGDRCAAGTCVGASPVVCPPGGPCEAASCDPLSGACSIVELPDDTRCSDGDACTGDDRCFEGTCEPGAPLSCDDGDPCTLDQCDADAGCSNPAPSGYPSVLCVFERTTIGAACTDPLPSALAKRLARTAQQLERAAGTATTRAACRRLGKGGRGARKVQGFATRVRDGGLLPFACGQAIVDEMIFLRARIADLRAARC